MFLTSICLKSLFSIANLQAEPVFRVGFPNIQPEVESGKVQTAEQYIFLIHLLRPLTTYTNNGEVVGDLAESWQISSDFKLYNFKIKPGQKFSNGDEITAEDAVNTIQRRLDQAYAIHYDFSKIESVKVVDKYSLQIRLKIADPFLIYELDHPEFRPLHKTDLSLNNLRPLSITSGYYFIKETAKNSFLLEANPFALQRLEGPKSVALSYLPKSKDPKSDSTKFLESDFDLIWSPRFADIEPPISKGYESHRPRLGFTFFASMNSDTLDGKNRRFIQKLLNPKTFTFKDTWRKKPAMQLFLPNGPGRISDSEATSIWSEITKSADLKINKKNLKILMPNSFEFSEFIAERLKKAGYVTTLKIYQGFTEYAEEIRSNNYDIVIANNDFSSIDLRGNIAVTFNEDRPLIMASRKNLEIRKLVDTIVGETNTDKRNALVTDLGRRLIKENHIVPIYYHEVLVLSKPGLDLTAWSQIVPEIGIWKIKSIKK